MVSFLLTPILSFFSVRLYRKALSSGLSSGFAYLAYLSGLFCILIVILCQFLLIPYVSNFMDWLIVVTPEVTITEKGLVTEAKQPYLVKHPTYGELYLIDTTKETPDLMQEKTSAPILIGKEDVIVKDSRQGQTRTFSLREMMLSAQQAHQALRITKMIMHQLAGKITGMVTPLAILILGPVFFIWKLLAALFYSVIAMLLNLIKKNRFSYRNLFVLSCYAISPVAMLQAVNFSIPGVELNLNYVYAFSLTILYLAFGMFVAVRDQR